MNTHIPNVSGETGRLFSPPAPSKAWLMTVARLEPTKDCSHAVDSGSRASSRAVRRVRSTPATTLVDRQGQRIHRRPAALWVRRPVEDLQRAGRRDPDCPRQTFRARQTIGSGTTSLLLLALHSDGSEREHRGLIQRDAHEDGVGDSFRRPVQYGALERGGNATARSRPRVVRRDSAPRRGPRASHRQTEGRLGEVTAVTSWYESLPLRRIRLQTPTLDTRPRASPAHPRAKRWTPCAH